MAGKVTLNNGNGNRLVEILQQNKQLQFYILGAIIGFVSGIVAVAFRYLIFAMGLLFTLIPQVFGVWGWVIAPAVGGGIVGIITLKYAPEAKGHGVPQVIEAYYVRGGKIRFRVPILESLAAAICLSSGGSCGREGPIAQISAGVGSSLASIFKLDRKATKTMVVCGVSAGIAATFNAPLGGTLFGIEVVAGGIVGFSIIPVILASVISTAVADFLLGSSVTFQAPLFTLGTYPELLLYFALGIILGLGSVVWIRGIYFIEGLFERLRIYKYAVPVIGGTLTGILALTSLWIASITGYVGVFGPRDLFYPAIMSNGYSFINAALAGSAVLAAMLAFGIMKLLATSFTLGSGGSGGVFAPTLFMGAAFGGTFGLVLQQLFPGVVINPMAYALVGMAALFAGTARAPITCIVIIMELTYDYSMILPLMITVSTAFFIASSIEPDSIYTFKLTRRGIELNQGFYIGALNAVKVRDIMTKTPTILRPEMTLHEVFDIMAESGHTKYPVIDENGDAVGCLIVEDICETEGPDGTPLTVADVMRKSFLKVDPECTVDRVLMTMLRRDEGHAVVVDPTNKTTMIGFITKTDVLKAYEVAILSLREKGREIQDVSLITDLGP